MTFVAYLAFGLGCPSIVLSSKVADLASAERVRRIVETPCTIQAHESGRSRAVSSPLREAGSG